METPNKSDTPVYSISPVDAVYLLALMKGGAVPERSSADLKHLLSEVCKLAESISSNCRDWLEIAGMIHGNIHPYTAEKLNAPTLRGALSSAVTVPRVDTSNCCPTCAFRVGSVANQTEAVAEDVMLSLESGETFYCHHGDDAPKHACHGFVAAMQRKRTPCQTSPC